MVYGNQFLNESDMSLLVLEQELDNFELLTEGFGDKVKEIFDKIAEWFRKIVETIKRKVLGAINTIKAKIFSKFTSSFIKGVTDKLEKEIGTTDFEIDLGEATSDDDEFEDESALIYTNEVVAEAIVLKVAKHYLGKYIGKYITKELFFDFDKYIKMGKITDNIALGKNMIIRCVDVVKQCENMLSKGINNITDDDMKVLLDAEIKTIDEIYRYLGNAEIFGEKFKDIIDKDLYKDMRNGAKKWLTDSSQEQYDRMVNAGKVSYNRLKELAIRTMDHKEYDKLATSIQGLINISIQIGEELDNMLNKIDNDKLNKIFTNMTKLLAYVRKYLSAVMVTIETGIKYSTDQKKQAAAIVSGFEKTALTLVNKKNQESIKNNEQNKEHTYA